MWSALSKSQAAQSGLLVHLEDAVLLVHGIGPDIVSDIATNLIRLPLIQYTQAMCSLYGIPTRPDVWSGPIWDSVSKDWTEGTYVPLPMAAGRRLVLTPKSIVRRHLAYDAKEYYGDHIIPFLEQKEISAGSSLVRVLRKKRTKYVTKKDLKAKYGADKAAIVDLTLQNPQLLQQYKQRKAQTATGPMSSASLACSSR